VATIGTLAARLTANTTDFVAKMNDSSKKMEKFSADARAVGSALTLNVTAPLTAAAGAGIFFANKLNEGMANVATLLTGSASPQERIAELRTEVQLASVAVGKSTDEMTSGLFDVISAFGDSGDTVERFRTISEAAVAGQASLSESLALSSAVTKAYGDTSAEAVQKVLDLAFKANELGQTTFPEMANAIQNVTSFSKSLGVSQEELFGTMATLTGVTGNASSVSTQLRSALVSLQAPTDALSDLYTSVGAASGKAAIEQFGLQGTLKLVTDAAAKSGTPLQDFIGRVEGQQIATELAGAQSVIYATKLAAMSKASGAAGLALDAQTNGINSAGFALKQLTQRAIVLAEDLGNALMPSFVAVIGIATPLVGFLSDAVHWFTTLDPTIQAVAIGAVSLVAAAGPILLALGTLTTLLPIVTTGVAALGTAFTLMTGPIGLTAAAVIGLITVWQLFGNEITRFVGASIDLVIADLNKMIDTVNWVSQGIGDALGIQVKAWEHLDATGRTTGTAFIEMMGGVVDANESYKESMSGVATVTTQVAGTVQHLKGTFVPVATAVDTTENKFKGFGISAQFMKDTLMADVAILKRMPTHLEKITAETVKTQNSFKSMAKSIAKDIFSTNGLLGGLSKKFGGLGSALSGLLGGGGGGRSGGGIGSTLLSAGVTAGLSFIPGGGLVNGLLGGSISKGIGKIFGFAGGGMVTRPTLAMVGDGGEPEHIIPASKMASFGAGAVGKVQVVLEMDGDIIASRTVDLMEQRGMVS
jgi:TP901 family phage tail tape measure protein